MFERIANALEDLSFVHPWLLLLALGAIPFFALCVYADIRKKRKSALMVAPSLAPRLAPRVSRRPAAQAALASAAFALLAVAAARPQSGETSSVRKTAVCDVAVAMDVSRSMLATDVRPDRLQRAKTHARDFAAALESGRLGIVAFRGLASVVCPLTSDRRFFNSELEELGVDSAPPGDTDLAKAVESALGTLKSGDGAAGAIVVFSDGGDYAGPEDVEKAASLAKDAGVPVFTVGVGTVDGATVEDPDGGKVKDADGNEVVVKLERENLERVSKSTGGRYFHAGEGIVTRQTWESFASDIVSRVSRRDEERKATRKNERFVWFLVPAAMLFAAACILSPGRSVRRRAKPAAAALAALLCAAACARCECPPETWNEAVAAWEAGDFAKTAGVLSGVRRDAAAAALRARATLASTNALPGETGSRAKRMETLAAAARGFREAARLSPADSRAAFENAFSAAEAGIPELRRKERVAAAAAKAKEEREKGVQPEPPADRLGKMSQTANEILSGEEAIPPAADPAARLAESARAAERVRKDIADGFLALQIEAAEAAASQAADTNAQANVQALSKMFFAFEERAVAVADEYDDFAPSRGGSLRSLEAGLHALRTAMLSPPELIRDGAEAQTNALARADRVCGRDWQSESALYAYEFDRRFPEWSTNGTAQVAQSGGQARPMSPEEIEKVKELSAKLVAAENALSSRFSPDKAMEAADVYEQIAELLPRPPPRSQSQSQDGNQSQSQNGNRNRNQDASQNENGENEAGSENSENGEDGDEKKDGERKPEGGKDGSEKEAQGGKEVEDGDKTSEAVKRLMEAVAEREGDFKRARMQRMRPARRTGLDL